MCLPSFAGKTGTRPPDQKGARSLDCHDCKRKIFTVKIVKQGTSIFYKCPFCGCVLHME